MCAIYFFIFKVQKKHFINITEHTEIHCATQSGNKLSCCSGSQIHIQNVHGRGTISFCSCASVAMTADRKFVHRKQRQRIRLYESRRMHVSPHTHIPPFTLTRLLSQLQASLPPVVHAALHNDGSRRRSATDMFDSMLRACRASPVGHFRGAVSRRVVAKGLISALCN